MARWIEYKYLRAGHTVRNLADSGGGASFTVGGFLEALERAGVRDKVDLDSIFFEVPMGKMVDIFGAPDIRVGEYEEIWGSK